MFTTTFWILAIWLVINGIWTCVATDNRELLKWFAWINVVAIIVGFWVFYGAAAVAALSVWFTVVNWVNVVLAIVQFYLVYRQAGAVHHA
ncbi:hypothetical protein [Levilactobacillus andaensis]|uniref:hypothetical protein n=1 Tax=Levilactobacillus andaensis TaxID=2799570 RepID=UPI0019415F58|nr:hypothetical protein [Levilactobacillus andaensis]